MPRQAAPPSPEEQLKPLSARSVVLSMLLGAHPQPLSASHLVRAGEYFAVPDSTLRAALTRAVASGELRREGRAYALGAALLTRQRRQEEALTPPEVPWAGEWEMAVVVVTGRAGSDRAALREKLTVFRLAELREGMWLRPANLHRTADYATHPAVNTFRAVPDQDHAELAADLWALDDWSARGHKLAARLSATSGPALRLAVAATLVRHLSTDPILPVELLPDGWPGAALRAAYASYQHELSTLVTSA